MLVTTRQPTQLHIALQQYATRALPQVQAHQHIASGQCLADHPNGVPVYAPRAGRVRSVSAQCITIDVDTDSHEAPALVEPHDHFLERVRQGAMVGLGGAAFPAHHKWRGTPHTLVINAMECEAPIHCDRALLSIRPDSPLRGGEILAEALGIARCVIAAKADFAPIFQSMLPRVPSWELFTPAPHRGIGAERTLLRALDGATLHGPASEQGYIVANLGTLDALARWWDHGFALTHRLVSVGNEQAYWAALGTPLPDLLPDTQDAQNTENAAAHSRTLRVGGLLSGTLSTEHHRGLQAQDNSLSWDDASTAPLPAEPCIRCARCAPVCPEGLLPQQLHWYQHQSEALVALGIDACTTCGACDSVCPSHIPLAAQFMRAKKTLRTQRSIDAMAERAQARFAVRNARQTRRAEQAVERRAQHRQGDKRQDAIAAALAKRRQRKAS